MSFIYVNGNFYEDSEAKISVKDRGFRFGDGVFETIAFYNGKLYRWDLHKKRLDDGLASIKIVFNSDRLENDILRTIQKNGLTTGLARLTITRGEGSRGYLPTEKATPNLVIEAMPRPPMEREHANLCVSKYKKIPLECLPVNYKITQGLSSTLAKMEAHEKGFFDALMLNVDNYISECSAGNIFWVKGKEIYTPRYDCDILEGVMRQIVLDKSPYSVIHGRFKLKELKRADEVFITNVAWKVLAVNEIEGIFKNKKGYNITSEIRSLIEKDITDQ